MADLTPTEKYHLEDALQMSSGYVLGFSNKSFARFIYDSVGLDIYSDKYFIRGDSKANRFRSFWDEEPNYIIGKVLSDLLLQAKAGITSSNSRGRELWDRCKSIAERLQEGSVVENANALKPNADGKDFAVLAKSIRDSLDRNEPEVAIDRLHTFCVKYTRSLCAKHGLQYVQDEPLNAIFGKYAKYLETKNIVESEAAIFILKSTIGVLSRFNDVRNNRSFAHDNPILKHQEALLIFNNIANTIKFVEHIEGIKVTKPATVANDPFDYTDFE
ncbi:MAG: abortive infection family protein [Geminicoccaceae bacterium]